MECKTIAPLELFLDPVADSLMEFVVDLVLNIALTWEFNVVIVVWLSHCHEHI